MTLYPIDDTQRGAARMAGAMYLITIAAANFGDFYVRARLFVHGNAVQTATNIAQSANLFRAGFTCDIVTFAGTAILAIALYRVLKPVSGSAALAGASFWLLECSVAAFLVLNSLAALFVFSGPGYLRVPDAMDAQALARLFVAVDTAGNRVAALLFGLGSVVFCYLWYKSRYIPRVLAALGILASLVPTITPLTTVLIPSMSDLPLRRARAGLLIAPFEVIVGLWLLVKGIQAPAAQASTKGT